MGQGEGIPYGLSMHVVQQPGKEEDMNTKSRDIAEELRPEYDFDYSKAIYHYCERKEAARQTSQGACNTIQDTED